jgi:hypothetical protein
MLNFSEFCEATSVNENNLSAEEAESTNVDHSTEKKDLEKIKH